MVYTAESTARLPREELLKPEKEAGAKPEQKIDSEKIIEQKVADLTGQIFNLSAEMNQLKSRHEVDLRRLQEAGIEPAKVAELAGELAAKELNPLQKHLEEVKKERETLLDEMVNLRKTRDLKKGGGMAQ